MNSGDRMMWTHPRRAQPVECEIVGKDPAQGWWTVLHRGVKYFARENELSPMPAEGKTAALKENE